LIDTLPQTLIWSDDVLSVLDQRALPKKIEYLHLLHIEDAHFAIKTLAVRGAPAIGVAAAYALAQSMQDSKLQDQEFHQQLMANATYLKSARPTAVNLAWAIDRVVAAYQEMPYKRTLVDCAQAIHQEDLAISLARGEHGAPLIQPNWSVLTHCNAGSLATSRLGTATAPMYTRHQQGIAFSVFADETRPLYQGARLTTWELEQAGIDTTLICDNMAASLMASGRIDMALVGTDRVTANGDVVNKIGTLNVAILCRHFDIPFYVACPSSTFDPATPRGQDVVIEQRDRDEVIGRHSTALKVLNPAFDVTPHELVTGIITEHGICAPSELRRQLSDLQ
jgi:methylthioribose-1-phosphate isomerase